MPSMDEIEARVTDALASFGVERDAIARDASLDALDVDSLDVVELCEILREEMGVDVEARDFNDVNTYGEVLDIIAARLSTS